MADRSDIDDVVVDTSDGRRARSERSRQKIIDALFELVQSGEMKPSAARVAETAKVSLRTVFRHFEEIDDLYREMTHQCRARVLPAFEAPYRSADWKENIFEHAERRLRAFEEIMYLRICGESRRFQSDLLMSDYRRFFQLEREGLSRILPDSEGLSEEDVASIDITLSFESYRRLRQESGFSDAKARAVVLQMLNVIVSQIAA